MGNNAPTIDSLERRLRKILTADTTHVQRYSHPNNAGEAEWEEGSNVVLISLDHFWHGELATLIHELTHYAMRLDRVWGELEEPMILGLEAELVGRIKKSVRRSEWWRSALNAKLREGVK